MTLVYVLAGILFCGGALVLQSAQSGGVDAYNASGFPPIHHQARLPSQPLVTAGAQASRQLSSGTSCAHGTGGGVADRAFAFDGRVVAVHRRPHSDTEAVTFAVGTWFAGGHRPRVTVQMSPDGLSLRRYRGAHLLVSGAPRCGFTLPYSASRAAQWRAALTGRH